MSELHLQPSFTTFQTLSSQGNLVPVWAELAADYETPLSAYQKIRDGHCSFLFESAELTQHSGRYSLLGTSPRTIITARGREIEVNERGQKRIFTVKGDPLEALEELMRPYRPHGSPTLPVFCGGAVGYLAYDMVRYFEPTLPEPPPDHLGLPDMVGENWLGFPGPAGVPAPVVDRIHREVMQLAKDPTIVARMRTFGITHQPLSPAEFQAYVSKEFTRWKPILEAATIDVN